MKRTFAAAATALALSGTLVMTASPAQATPQPLQLPADLPAPLRAAAEAAEEFGTIGWDEKGPYIVWGNLRCRIHLFVPEEWSWAWGTGPCWF
jgi:hypothetical protein